MRKTFIFLILAVTLKSASAQIEIGLKHDINGIPINGYFDPLLYSPQKKITTVHNSDSYETGYYYNKNGAKIKGLIKFESKLILYKKGEGEPKLKIKAEEGINAVIGVDSLFTISNFYYQNKIREEPEYVQYITKVNGLIFVKHYQNNASNAYNNQSPLIETYLVKGEGDAVWDNFPNSDKFKGKALRHFSYIPYLNDKISSGEYTSKDMASIIKMAEYTNKYKNSEPILFDSYWQEIKDSKKAEYVAKITKKVDSIWTFEYYKGNKKLYKVNYSAFYPNIKNGEFISYYPTGEIRQIDTFLNNKPQETKTFTKEGVLKIKYRLIEKDYEKKAKTYTEIKYIVVNDSLGNNCIINDTSTSQSYDALNAISYTSNFNKRSLISYYRASDKGKIYQFTDPEEDFNIKPLQRKFEDYINEDKYQEAISANVQGIVLASLLIDDKGYVVESEILNSLHPELDTLVSKFISKKLLEGAKYRYKFKPYKKDKAKQFFEVVVPFEFSINRFYRQPYNMNWNWHIFWQMHNQMFMNPQQPLTIPNGLRN